MPGSQDAHTCFVLPGTLSKRRLDMMFMLVPCSITEVIERDAKCPMDRRPLSLGDLYDRPPPMEFTQAPVRREETPEVLHGSSAKIDQLIQLLRLIPSDQKSLVFSQFTSFLDKVVEALEDAGYVCAIDRLPPEADPGCR